MHGDDLVYSTHVHEDLTQLESGEFVVYPLDEEVVSTGRGRVIMIANVPTHDMFVPVGTGQSNGMRYNYACLNENQVRLKPQNNTHEVELITFQRRLTQERKPPPPPQVLPLVPPMR